MLKCYRKKKLLGSFSSHHLKISLALLSVFLIASLFVSVSYAQEEDEEDEVDKGMAQDFGWAAVGLFGVSILYVLFYQFFMNSRRILPKNEKFEKRREVIKKVFLKVRKPLRALHYFAGIIAIGILFTHGISLINQEAEKVIIGLTTASIYLFYVISGIMIKLVLKKSKKGLKLKKFLFKIHTSLLLIALIGTIHLIHIAIAE